MSIATPETNGDRIRRMTDTELAGILSNACQACIYGKKCRSTSDCQQGILKWLKNGAESKRKNENRRFLI